MLRIISTAVVLFLAWSNQVLAQSTNPGITGFNMPSTVPTTGVLLGWLRNIGYFMLTAGVIIAVIVLAFTGIRWMTSGADATKSGNAKKAFFNALLGIIVLFAIGLILITASSIGRGTFFDLFN
jgi:hypothetical protein